MSIGSKISVITMELYETEISELLQFIQSETKEKFTEKYLILYNFAIDCRYSKNIQRGLIEELLPYYLTVIEQAVVYGNKKAIDIYFQFNLAMFFNRDTLKNAIGENKYKGIMEFYINQVIVCMGIKGQSVMEWGPLFNTSIALNSGNIYELFKKVMYGKIQLKYTFFKYLSVLVFKESDNLLVENETKEFWSSDIWLFDDGYFGSELFWEEEAVKYFDEIITINMLEKLFDEIRPLMYDEFGAELVKLLEGEMKRSFDMNVFSKRKSEYLDKISCKSAERIYWDSTF